jgi:ketosteroid isomerase-like protein
MGGEVCLNVRDTERVTERVTSNENVEVVRRVFGALNSGDIDLIPTLTHPDFEVEVPPALSAEPDVYRGHDGVRRYWESFQDAMQEIHFEPQRFWVAGETVVVAMRITAKGRRTAIAVEQQTAGVWTIREGKALRAQVYASASEALEVAGLAYE